MKTKLLSLASALLLCLYIQAQANLIYNGDFSLGNIGFTSEQTYSDYYTPCDYYVGSTWFNTASARHIVYQVAECIRTNSSNSEINCKQVAFNSCID